jgi:SAM-dependent methyltransferase
VAIGLAAAAWMGPLPPERAIALAASGTALSIPMLLALHGVRSADRLPSAAAHGAALVMAGGAMLLPAAALMGPDAGQPIAGLAACAATLLIAPVAWCRLRRGDNGHLHPLPLLPLRRPRLTMLPFQRLVLVLIASGMLALAQRAWHDPDQAVRPWIWLLPLLAAASWHFTVGGVRMMLVVSAVGAGWLGFASLPHPELTATGLITAFALAQPMPLTLWHARRFQRAWPWWGIAGIGLACALAAPGSDLALAVAGASLAGCLAVVVDGERQPRATAVDAASGNAAPERVLALARRACQQLEPYARFYATSKLRFDPLYRQLAEDAQPWGRVLDAGCGPGLVAALAFGRREPAYCGIDLDEDKLDTARRTLALLGRPLDQDWQLLRGRLPFTQPLTRRFDTAVLGDVLHYWPPEGQAELLRQLHQALVDGGRLLLREGCAGPDGDAGLVGIAERFTTWIGLNPSSGGLHFLDEERMRELLAANGFAVEACVPSGGANRLWRCRRT